MPSQQKEVLLYGSYLILNSFNQLKLYMEFHASQRLNYLIFRILNIQIII